MVSRLRKDGGGDEASWGMMAVMAAGEEQLGRTKWGGRADYVSTAAATAAWMICGCADNANALGVAVRDWPLPRAPPSSAHWRASAVLQQGRTYSSSG